MAVVDGVIDFDAPPVAKSAEEVMRPAIEEMTRRETIARTFDPKAVQRFPTSGTGAVWDDLAHEQQHVLMTVGTRVMAPRPVDPRYPALRVYGCFREREEAVEHSEVVKERDPRSSLVVARRGEWFLFPQDEDVLRSPGEADRRCAARLALHEESRRAQDRAFDDAVEKNVDRPVNWDRTEWSEDQQEEREAVDSVYTRLRRIRAGAEVRGQSCCALLVVPDPTERGEVLIKVLGCFDGVQSAEEWVRDVGSRSETTHDILLAPTCEWIYPNGDRHTSQKEMYRIGELQKIMDGARRNPANVRNFKEWKRQGEERERAREARMREDTNDDTQPHAVVGEDP